MCGPRGEKPLDPGGSFLIIIFSDARRKGGDDRGEIGFRGVDNYVRVGGRIRKIFLFSSGFFFLLLNWLV